MPSVWQTKDVSKPTRAEYLQGVFSHEMTHTRLLVAINRRVRELASALIASPAGASLTLDFIPYAPWVPRRDRSWRAVEGLRRTPEETAYLLLESREPDYLIQAGVNATGFLSYLYLSPAYASGRGTDALSKVIHPGPDSSLRGFRNLVWDLSGSADFVTLQVTATISGPAGSPNRITLRRQ